VTVFALMLRREQFARGAGDRVAGWAEVLAAFAFVRLLTAIPITPGGLGVVELGLIAALTAGGDHAEVVGALLVLRGLTYLLPIPLGLLTYLFWLRNTSWRDSAPPLPPLSIDEPAVAGAT
jgi:uncharacterized membrane protein YbhN (UPF0104 family)